MNQLRVLKRKEIDEQKWNALIQSSVQSLPYALSYYLDAVAENWEAVVLNHYEAAMPLVWLRKLGLKCLYQPYYCQQLGIFSKQLLSGKAMKEMLAVAHSFPYTNINLNPSAKIIATDFSLKKKKNLLLDLGKDYTAIRKKYSENHKRNIAKAEKSKLAFTEEVELKPFQKFYLQNINRTKENFKPQHEKIFKALTKTLTANRTAKIFAVINEEQELVAAVLLVLHQNRLVGIINTSSAEGKKSGASHFLFDKIIRKYSNAGNVIASEGFRSEAISTRKEEIASQTLPMTNLVLDFEGSSVPTIARFYEGFGATEEIFYNYQTTLIKKLSQRFFINISSYL